MSNPIFDAIGSRRTVSAPQMGGNNIMQNLFSFARTIRGNPEQMVKELISSGRMSQEQFQMYSNMANQILPRNK